MHLYVDGRSSFLGGPRPETKPGGGQPPPAAAGPPPEKAHIAIKTPGRFVYELFKDHDQATFEVPAAKSVSSPQDVTVTRFHEQLDQLDQLVCQHLEMRMRHKEKPAEGAPRRPARGWIRAWTSRPLTPPGRR